MSSLFGVKGTDSQVAGVSLAAVVVVGPEADVFVGSEADVVTSAAFGSASPSASPHPARPAAATATTTAHLLIDTSSRSSSRMKHRGLLPSASTA